MARPDKSREHYDAKLAEIIGMMEKGDLPWNRPWKMGANGLPVNPTTGNPYRGGINFLIMLLAGFGDARWMGFGQAKKKGWNVTKGSKATTIYAPNMRWITDDETGQRRKVCVGFRLVKIFNAEQVEGCPPLEDFPPVDPEEGYENAAALLKQNGAVVKHGGDRASYNPSLDCIRMPEAGAFDTVDQYWGTALHELAHWSGHKSRLNRDQKGYGDVEAYAYEELVAEICSAFLCTFVGIEREDMTRNHAAYLKSWVKRCKSEPKVLAMAANQAWTAFCHLTGYTHENE